MDKKLRERVYGRSRGTCEKCGRGLGYESMAAHHRRLKGQGGQDDIVNLLALHHACHNMGDDAVHMNPHLSVKNGWIVPSYWDPAKMPVLISMRRAVILEEDGTYRDVDYCFTCCSWLTGCTCPKKE